MSRREKAGKMPAFEAGGIYNAAKRKGLLPRRGLRETLASFLRRHRGGTAKRPR
ncbi:hypothetical protein [Salinibacterium sp.]|uniref:hypothetical protein n=1 Tax=Salinibacterium sp. TaxID=1915057 RepID=UPI00286C7B18|nr:hypothetical protein [Salinibacterium sp.]